MSKLLILFGVMVFLILLIFLTSNLVSFNKVDSWLERAKDAGNPQQVSEFLTEYKSSLQDRSLIDNKYYSYWKYPATKMDVYIRVIDGLIDRANDLALQNPTDTSFQMGLTNLEKDLGDIDARAVSVWIVNGGIYLIISTIAIGNLPLIGAFVIFLNDDI